MLVPLLSFDPVNLTRLGYGGGYYDRTIEQARAQNNNLMTIGIALECLKHENLPIDQSNGADQPLDYIVTENGTY